MRIVGADLGHGLTHILRDQGRLGQLGEGRQPHTFRFQQRDGAGTRLASSTPARKSNGPVFARFPMALTVGPAG